MQKLLLPILCLFLSVGQSQSLKIISNGNVGIGTSSPTSRLDVVGQVKHSGLRSTADKRLKKNIEPLSQGLREVLKMTPIVYNYNGKAGTSTSYRQIGILAEEVEKLVPSMISKEAHYEKKGVGGEAVLEEYLSIQSDAIQYVLINAIKEQNELLNSQSALLRAQTDRIESLEADLDRLTTLVEGGKDIGDTREQIDVMLQGEYRLGQNEPNPFTEMTQIAYEIPSGSNDAQIEFYGMNGSLLKTVRVGNGKGTLNLSQQDLPNGQYTYRLVVDGVSIASKRMTLIK